MYISLFTMVKSFVFCKWISNLFSNKNNVELGIKKKEATMSFVYFADLTAVSMSQINKIDLQKLMKLVYLV